MKPLVISAALVLSLSTLCGVANAAKPEGLAPWPKAEAGYSRQVIHLPKQKNEDDYKVQIIAGKTLQVDCNQQRLGGKLEEKNPQGLGLSDVSPEQGQRPHEHNDGLPRGQGTS